MFAEQPLLEYYDNSELVLVGKVISLSQVTSSIPSQDANQTRYDIQVEEYYKNPQSAKLVTVYGYAKGIYYGNDPTFDVGDRLFLYLKKYNTFYQIQPHSFKLNNDCYARPLIPLFTLPFEQHTMIMSATSSFVILDSHGNIEPDFPVNQKIRINFDAENVLPVVRHAILDFYIKTENGTKLVFHDKREVTIPACNGNVPISLDFLPEKSGLYGIQANMSGGIDLGRETVLFTEPVIGSGFVVTENGVNTTSLILSPLKQFKSGIAPSDIQCKTNFALIFKAKDGSPACVKPSSAPTLILRGWATESNKGHLVFQMKPESTAQLFVKYNPVLMYQEMQLYSRVYDGKTGYQIPSSKLAVTAEPDIIPSNATINVTYTITSHDKGVYWLNLDICNFIPIVVGIDRSEITQSDLQNVMSGWKCPYSGLQTQITNSDGMIPTYVEPIK